MEESLIDTWAIHNRIVLYLLEAIADEALADAIGRGKNVGGQFSHIHGVRLMWLKASAPDLLEGLTKIEETDKADKELLRRSLEASGTAIESLLRRGVAEGRIKSFKPHPAAFLGYLIAHESYHTGKVDLILRQSGHPVSDKVHYGLWEWSAR